MAKKYGQLTDKLTAIKSDLESNADIILSVNEIAFLNKLLWVMRDFINGKLE